MVMVSDDGSNMILLALGANSKVAPDMIESATKFMEHDTRSPPECVYADPCVESSFEMKRKRALTFFGPGPGKTRSSSDAWRSADLLMPNQMETFELRAIEGGDFAIAARGGEALDLGPGAALIPLGAQRPDAATCSFALRAFTVKAVGTTAARDAFNGHSQHRWLSYCL